MKKLLGICCDDCSNRIELHEADFNTIKNVKKIIEMIYERKAVLTRDGFHYINFKYDWAKLFPKEYEEDYYDFIETMFCESTNNPKNILIWNFEDIAKILSGEIDKNYNAHSKIILPEGKYIMTVEAFKDIVGKLQENITLGKVNEEKLLKIWDEKITNITNLDADIDYEDYTLGDVYFKLFDYSMPFAQRVEVANNMLLNMILDEEKPLYLKSVPEDVMERILISIEKNYANGKVSNFYKKCYISFMDKLCNLDNRVGLDIKAYAYYGGNSIVDCNYKISEECLLKLVDMYYISEYANTLGYIYYYGRVNGGEPEYEKAFNYFSMAAINGNVESIYKLGDMYRNGYGVKQNEEVARITYENLYDRVLSDFYENPENSNLSDVALRIASFYDGYENGALPAAILYLQALMAIHFRHNFYDEDIKRKITAYVVDLYECFGDTIRKEFALVHALAYCKKYFVKRVEDSIIITNERKTIVVDIQDMNCEFTDKIVVNFKGKIIKDFKKESLCTKIEINSKGEYVFYRNNTVIGKIAPGPYEIEHKHKLIKNIDTNVYKVAICQYNKGSGRKYTFFYDDVEDINESWYVEENGKDVYPIEFKIVNGYELPCDVNMIKHIKKKVIC